MDSNNKPTIQDVIEMFKESADKQKVMFTDRQLTESPEDQLYAFKIILGQFLYMGFFISQHTYTMPMASIFLQPTSQGLSDMIIGQLRAWGFSKEDVESLLSQLDSVFGRKDNLHEPSVVNPRFSTPERSVNEVDEGSEVGEGTPDSVEGSQ